MSPFNTIKSYSEMLNKIALFTFIGCLLILFILRWSINDFDKAIKDTLELFDIAVSIKGINISLSNIVLAAFIALLFRITKMHDRISDVFRIRKFFDVNIILFPMATMMLNKVNLSTRDKIYNNRSTLIDLPPKSVPPIEGKTLAVKN